MTREPDASVVLDASAGEFAVENGAAGRSRLLFCTHEDCPNARCPRLAIRRVYARSLGSAARTGHPGATRGRSPVEIFSG